MTWSFWVDLVVDPLRTLDLVDREGKPDHGKILPAVLLLSAIVLQFMNKQYSVGVLLTLGSLSYGYGSWRAFLRSKVATSQETLNKTDITIVHRKEEILARRDVEQGIDPTYE